MTDFIREVDEAFRRDQAIELWKRYQNWIIGAALLIVLGTAAWRVYEYYRISADEAGGARYEAALQLLRDGKSAQALAAFEAMTHNSPKGYAALARLVSADEIGAHDPKAAIRAYDALVTDPNFDPSLKDLAQIRAAFLRADVDAPKEFEQRYAALADANGPFRNSLRELLALAALKDGDDKAAEHWLDQIIIDPAATEALRQRANALIALAQAGRLPGQ
jgi:hypothetical protein